MLGRFMATILCALMVLAAGAQRAPSEEYPTRAIQILVGFAAGGANDIVARLVGQRLSEILGQPVVIENRTGAGGTIAANVAAKAQPDGYTLFMAAGAHALAPSLFTQLPYDTVADFTPIGMVGRGGYLLTVHPSLPAKSVEELVQLSKARRLTFASSGLGAPPHLAGELFNLMAGTKLEHIPYKGEAPAIPDMIAGRIDVAFMTVGGTVPLIRAGQLRGLAVTGSQRSSMIPELATIAESGLPGYDVGTWWGLLAPAKTPSVVVKRLNDALQKIVADPAYKQSLSAQGMDAAGSSPSVFSELIKIERERYAKLAAAANIKPQ